LATLQTLCRDCLTTVATPSRPIRCANCGSPRVTAHEELLSLSIAHVDCDAFYASIEKRDNPSLLDKPLIIGGGQRGVVSTCCYLARQFGVRSAMPMFQAKKLCPHAVVLIPNMKKYVGVSREVRTMMDALTPLVEPLSIDEAFLDVGGLRRLAGTPVEIATRLRAAVWDDVGLRISVGVARTKFLAKVASAVSKPDGLLVVPPEGELDFLHPLPVERLWGVGDKTAVKLHARGLHRVQDIARLEPAALEAILGKAGGRHLGALAHNRDPRPVEVGRRRRSIGAQHAMGRRPQNTADIDASVMALADRVTRRMRAAQRVGRTVLLRLRFGDFERATRSTTLPHATADTAPILDAARGLLAAATPEIERRGLTLVGIAVQNLSADDAVQLGLPFEHRSRASLDRVADQVRERFGAEALGRAALLGRGSGFVPPQLPD
jgi:DNA polymerase-4